MAEPGGIPRPATLELLAVEHEHLRQELEELKRCQVAFLRFSLTTTAVLLSSGGLLGAGVPLSAVTLLAPLVVLLPAWVVFFDKATTVSRIVGYVRCLEHLRLHPEQVAAGYSGWESGLRAFRDVDKSKVRESGVNLSGNGSGRVWLQRTRRLRDVLFRPKLVYLTSVYYAFACSSLLSIAASAMWFFLVAAAAPRASGVPTSLWAFAFGVACLATCAAAAYSLYLLFHVSDPNGLHSYDVNEATWRQVLGLPARLDDGSTRDTPPSTAASRSRAGPEG